MRRFSGRLLAVVVLAVSLSMVPVGTASASPWAGFGLDGGFFAKVELLVVRVLARFAGGGERPGVGQAKLDEGATRDPNGSD